MKRENIFCAFALTMLTASLFAAEVSKEVEVVNSYIPEVKNATKLHLKPDTSNDAYIKPDIDYSITPISIATVLENELYNPVKVNLEEYDPSERFYAKVGVGAPIQSVVDLYATPIKSKDGFVMGYFNQLGQFAKVENDFRQLQKSTKNQMRAGLTAGKYVANKVLIGELGYNNSKWSRYATNGDYDYNPLYQSLDFEGKIGDNFIDLSRLNFNVDAGASYFWSRSDYQSARFNAGVLFGYEILNGDLTFGANYRNTTSYTSDDYKNNSYGAEATYAYDGDYWGVKIGLQYLHDKVNSDINNFITPKFELSYQLNNKSVAYIAADGEVMHYDYASLSKINPYLAPSLYLQENGVGYDFNIGVEGTAAEKRFGYNIFFGYELNHNHLFWALLLDGDIYSGIENMFVANIARQSSFNMNIELEYQPLSNLNVAADFKIAEYIDESGEPYESGDAAVELNLSAKYSVGRWNFGIDGELLSRRDFTTLSYIYGETLLKNSVKIPTSFDLGLNVDYKLKNSMILFVDAQNLLNRNLYQYVGYREYGINFMAGLKIEF